jgi:hypothetical protein
LHFGLLKETGIPSLEFRLIVTDYALDKPKDKLLKLTQPTKVNQICQLVQGDTNKNCHCHGMNALAYHFVRINSGHIELKDKLGNLPAKSEGVRQCNAK